MKAALFSHARLFLGMPLLDLVYDVRSNSHDDTYVSGNYQIVLDGNDFSWYLVVASRDYRFDNDSGQE